MTGEHAIEKSIAMFGDHVLDAGHINEIDTMGENGHGTIVLK